MSWHSRHIRGHRDFRTMDRVLVIRRDLVDAMVGHARRDHPDEACGVIAGPEGSGHPERFVPMVNAARSPTFYEFESGDLLRLYRDMARNDEVPVVIYHSHTATEAYPSRTDVKLAAEPGAHYVLVSTRDPQRHELRSYRIVDGQVTEEPVEVVESYMFAHTGADDVPDCR
jgi:[CysO sulfur-carrier protein]-S-L-cysteine hydrolase